MTPSPEWQVLLEGFRPLFTKPGYRYFCAFVLVFAHLDRRLWVTQVVLADLVERHFTSYYRFLRQGRWSLTAVRQHLWRLCLARCRDTTGHLFVGVDDTVCGKTGRHFAGLGWHHDPMNRQHPQHLTHGHCWVCLAGLAEQTRDHFVALFLGAALYRQAKTCQQGEPFATKLELAAGLVAELAPPPGTVLAAVADGAYARRLFVRPLWAQECHLVSRLRRDTVFYDLPPARRKGRKGRPRKYGRKHRAREWAASPQRWHTEYRADYPSLSLGTDAAPVGVLGSKSRARIRPLAEAVGLSDAEPAAGTLAAALPNFRRFVADGPTRRNTAAVAAGGVTLSGLRTHELLNYR